MKHQTAATGRSFEQTCIGDRDRTGINDERIRRRGVNDASIAIDEAHRAIAKRPAARNNVVHIVQNICGGRAIDAVIAGIIQQQLPAAGERHGWRINDQIGIVVIPVQFQCAQVSDRAKQCERGPVLIRDDAGVGQRNRAAIQGCGIGDIHNAARAAGQGAAGDDCAVRQIDVGAIGRDPAAGAVINCAVNDKAAAASGGFKQPRIADRNRPGVQNELRAKRCVDDTLGTIDESQCAVTQPSATGDSVAGIVQETRGGGGPDVIVAAIIHGDRAAAGERHLRPRNGQARVVVKAVDGDGAGIGQRGIGRVGVADRQVGVVTDRQRDELVGRQRLHCVGLADIDQYRSRGRNRDCVRRARHLGRGPVRGIIEIAVARRTGPGDCRHVESLHACSVYSVVCIRMGRQMPPCTRNAYAEGHYRCLNVRLSYSCRRIIKMVNRRVIRARQQNPRDFSDDSQKRYDVFPTR